MHYGNIRSVLHTYIQSPSVDLTPQNARLMNGDTFQVLPQNCTSFLYFRPFSFRWPVLQFGIRCECQRRTLQKMNKMKKKRTIFREKKSMSQSLSNSYKTLSPQNIQMQRHFCVCVYNLYCSFTLADSCFVFVGEKLSKCYYIVERMLLMIKSTIRQTRNEHFNRFCESESIEQRNLAKNIKL